MSNKLLNISIYEYLHNSNQKFYIKTYSVDAMKFKDHKQYRKEKVHLKLKRIPYPLKRQFAAVTT